MSLDTIHNIVTVALLIGDGLFVILSFVCSSIKAKAVEEENQKDAAMYETAERIFTCAFCVCFLFTLVNVDLQIVSNGFINVIKRLEVLTRGH